jgi:PAS domain S-box-containing protein
MGNQFPFATLFFAVLLTAWYGGFGPALVAVVIGALTADYFLIPLRGSFRVKGRDQLLGLILYLTVGFGIALLGGAMQAARRKAGASASAYARRLIEASLDPLVTISPEGRITDVNEATVRATGVSREALVGSHFSDYFTEPDRAEAGYKVVLSKGEVRDYPLTLHHVSGRAIHVLYNATIYRDDMGTVQGVFAAARDVTERKRAEEALQRAQERLLLSQQAAGIGHFSWDIRNNVNEWSEELMALYGLPPDGFGGKYESWRERVFPDDRAEAHAAIERSLTGGEFLQDFRVVWPDGSVRWLHARAKVFFSEDGKPLRMVGVNMDITERKQAEEAIRRLNAELEERVRQRTDQLEAANKELEAFAYSVSHDLRAPLRAIGGFSQLLEEDYGGRLDAEGRRAIARIVAGTRTMGQLIDDLLKLSRVSRGELRRERVDLSEIARDVAAGHRRLEPDRKVEVVIAPGAVVEGDSQLLRVAMENLLGNAFKFTARRHEARIEFGVERNGEALVYFVRDNGAGFDATYAGKLFEAFQRLHTAAEFPGTGIGLATVQRILHRHGGRAWAEGAVDGGATFRFTL